MSSETAVDIVGEVHCLNCGRTLADAVRNPMNGKVRLRPARNQYKVQVSVIDQRRLRCDHCLGTAFIEPLIWDNIHADTAVTGVTAIRQELAGVA